MPQKWVSRLLGRRCVPESGPPPRGRLPSKRIDRPSSAQTQSGLCRPRAQRGRAARGESLCRRGYVPTRLHPSQPPHFSVHEKRRKSAEPISLPDPVGDEKRSALRKEAMTKPTVVCDSPDVSRGGNVPASGRPSVRTCLPTGAREEPARATGVVFLCGGCASREKSAEREGLGVHASASSTRVIRGVFRTRRTPEALFPLNALSGRPPRSTRPLASARPSRLGSEPSRAGVVDVGGAWLRAALPSLPSSRPGVADSLRKGERKNQLSSAARRSGLPRPVHRTPRRTSGLRGEGRRNPGGPQTARVAPATATPGVPAARMKKHPKPVPFGTGSGRTKPFGFMRKCARGALSKSAVPP